jgi:hypothetical protein
MSMDRMDVDYGCSTYPASYTALGEKMWYKGGKSTQPIYAFSNGFTRIPETLEPAILMQLSCELGCDHVAFMLRSYYNDASVHEAEDGKCYVHPFAMHWALQRVSEHHRCQLVVWLARILEFHNHHPATTLELHFAPRRAQEQLDDAPVDYYLLADKPNMRAEIDLCRDHRRVALDLLNPSLEPRTRDHMMTNAITLIVAWQRGKFADVDTDVDEVYIDGMVDTFGRLERESAHD